MALNRSGVRPKPLGITCTSTDCENDLHCFLRTRKMRAEQHRGVCRDCGLELVDMLRVHRRDLTDVGYTFEAMRKELIRHHFWCVPLDQRAINHARRKGRQGIVVAADQRLRSSVGNPHHPREGRQTPFSGSALYYAQHAVAACCRRCIEEWHGIPRDRALTEDEIEYLKCLVVMYVFDRLPDLTEAGEFVPRLTSRPRIASILS